MTGRGARVYPETIECYRVWSISHAHCFTEPALRAGPTDLQPLQSGCEYVSHLKGTSIFGAVGKVVAASRIQYLSTCRMPGVRMVTSYIHLPLEAPELLRAVTNSPWLSRFKPRSQIRIWPSTFQLLIFHEALGFRAGPMHITSCTDLTTS